MYYIGRLQYIIIPCCYSMRLVHVNDGGGKRSRGVACEHTYMYMYPSFFKLRESAECLVRCSHVLCEIFPYAQ